MGRSEAARTALLDAAERLFALEGIAQVSDRRIAEAAGNTNHSAVRYYFTSRKGLLDALVTRHMSALEEPRRRLFQSSDSVLGDVRSLVMPAMAVLETLPQPTYRARFLGQVLHDPVLHQRMRQAGELALDAQRIRSSLTERLAHLDPVVVLARSNLIVRIVMTAASEVESRAEAEQQVPPWPDVGDFLCDAIAGMLTAPISNAPAGVPRSP